MQTAEEALEQIGINLPDLVLLDVEIPHMGGFILCQKLRHDPRTQKLPVVFLSVRDSDFDKRTAMNLGANFYITKPFRRSQLLKEVDRLLSPASVPAEAANGAPAPAAVEESVGARTEPAAPPGFWRSRLQALEPVANKVRDRLVYYFKFHKWISITVAFIVIMGLMWGSVAASRKIAEIRAKNKKQVKAAEAETSVNVMQVTPGPFQDILNAVGTIAGGAEIELRFQTEGNIAYLNFQEGDAVRAGQEIARLDQRQALIKLDRARNEFVRYDKIYKLGGVSKDKLEEARTAYEFAQSELDKTVLRAPKEGILGDKGVEVGEFVTPQKKVGTLVSLDTVLVKLGVIEKEIDKILPGQNVVATVDTYPNVEFKGKVENISPLVQGQSKTLTVEARIPNENKLLLPGMFARTKIVVYQQDNVIAIPNDALEKTENGYQVYVVGRDNKAEVRPIEVSYVSVTHSVVSKGLNPGEQVIVQKPQDLKAGAPLKIVEVEKQGAGGGGEQKTGDPDKGIPNE